MKLLDIKNNLVKVSYSQEEQITLASFIVLTDNDKSYIAQVVNLKAEPTANYAIAKLILVFNNDGILDNFDGSIPSLQANALPLDANQLLALLPIEKPIAIGELAQQRKLLNLDITILEKRLLICAEKFDNINIIVNNFANQLSKMGEKAVIIDTDYTFEEYEPIKFKKDFKLPLNVKMLDFIYENDLEETDASTKAVIQDILSDVRDYAKSVEFIPFENFIQVVSNLHKQTQIPELVLLKNKLLKYNEQNIFAQTKEDLESLEKAIKANSVTYVDIADVSDELQKELIQYIQDTLEHTNEYIYSFVKVNNKNTDKKSLLKLTNSEKVFTTIICSHSYKYVSELKQLAENIILFAPQTAQHDFAAYNTFLSKLNANEFIVYGDLTQNIPFVVELANIEEILESYPVTDPSINTIVENEEAEATTEDTADLEFNDITVTEDTDDIVIEEDFTNNDNEFADQVAKDVDEAFFSNKVEDIKPIENLLSDQDEVLTEDDLDFIDDLAQDTEEVISEEPVVEDISTDFTEVPEKEERDFEVAPSEEPALEEQTGLYEEDDDTNNETELSSEEPEFDNANLDESLIKENSDFEEVHTEEGEADDLPVFPVEEVSNENTIAFEQGDEVSHPKYGKGIVEKLIKYGNKTLCSISFEGVGIRLLDPHISELQKLS